MSAAVKDVGGDSADCDFDSEESEFAVIEDARHECVAFGCDVHANPKKCQLGIKPVKSEQETTFGKLTHGNLTANVVKLRSYYAETPGAGWRRGFLTSREERDSFLCLVKTVNCKLLPQPSLLTSQEEGLAPALSLQRGQAALPDLLGRRVP